MTTRGERRRAEREAEKRRTATLIVGDGIIAKTLPGHTYEAIGHAELPPKIIGVHRWIATAAYVMNYAQVAAADDVDTMKFLDQENLMHLAIGCWDCERPLGAITFDSRCPAEGDQ